MNITVINTRHGNIWDLNILSTDKDFCFHQDNIEEVVVESIRPTEFLQKLGMRSDSVGITKMSGTNLTFLLEEKYLDGDIKIMGVAREHFHVAQFECFLATTLRNIEDWYVIKSEFHPRYEWIIELEAYIFGEPIEGDLEETPSLQHPRVNVTLRGFKQ